MATSHDWKTPIISPFKTPSILILYAPVLIDYLGVQFLQPVLPDITRSFADASDMADGKRQSFVMSSFTLGQFIGASLLGFLSDKFGRKNTLLMALTGSVIAYTLAALVKSYWLFVACRFLIGIAGGNRAVVLAYVGDIVPYSQMPKWAVVVSTLAGFTATVGPFVGGAIGDSVNGQAALFINAGLALFAIALMFLCLQHPQWYVDRTVELQRQKAIASGIDVETGVADAEVDSKPKDSSAATTNDAVELMTKTAWFVVFCLMFTAATNSFNDQAWQTLFAPVLKSFNINGTKKGLLMGVQGLVQLFVCLLVWVPLTRTVGVPKCICLGAVLYMTPLLFPLIQESLPCTVVLSCFLKIAATLIGTGCPVIVKLVTVKSNRGRVNGYYVSTGKFLALISPMVVGFVYDVSKIFAVITMGIVGGCGFLCALCAYRLLKRYNSESSASATAKQKATAAA